MTELVRHNSSSTIEMAKLMADSTLLPAAYRKQPANLLFAFEYADAIGIPRINALTSIHVIDGKPSASADLIAALVRRAGHKIRVSGDDTYCEVTIIRADDPDYVPAPVRWDLAKAKQAQLLGKGNWAKYPGAMLRARATTEAARSWASDALYGIIYTPEELGATVDADGEPVEVEVERGPVMSLTDKLQARADFVPNADAKRRVLDAVGGDRERAVEVWDGRDGITPDELDELLNELTEPAAEPEAEPETEIVADPEPEPEPDDIVEAEIVAEQEQAPAAPRPPQQDTTNDDDQITDAQLKKLHAMLRAKFGNVTGPNRFPILATALKRPVGSTKELSRADASYLFELFELLPDGDNTQWLYENANGEATDAPF